MLFKIKTSSCRNSHSLFLNRNYHYHYYLYTHIYIYEPAVVPVFFYVCKKLNKFVLGTKRGKINYYGRLNCSRSPRKIFNNVFIYWCFGLLHALCYCYLIENTLFLKNNYQIKETYGKSKTDFISPVYDVLSLVIYKPLL